MFIKLTEFYVSPTKQEGEPAFDVDIWELHVNTDKIHTFNQIDFHDSHQYNDFQNKKGDDVQIPRSIVVEGVEYRKVTKVHIPAPGGRHNLSDYIHVLEKPEEIMEKISGASAKPEEPTKKKRGRPPGSKNKPKDKNVNEGDKK